MDAQQARTEFVYAIAQQIRFRPPQFVTQFAEPLQATLCVSLRLPSSAPVIQLDSAHAGHTLRQGSQFRSSPLAGQHWSRSAHAPEQMKDRTALEHRQEAALPDQSRRKSFQITITQALSMTYRHRPPNRRNPPFNTPTCRTTKEINSLMAASGIG